MNKINRILVIRFGGIGDILFTLPAVNLLRRSFPESKISYLTKKSFAPLISGFTAVDRIIALDTNSFKNKNAKELFRNASSFIKEIRQSRFDLVVDFHGLGETCLITWLSSSRQRWGIIRKKINKIFFTVKLAKTTAIHPVDLNIQLLEQAGIKRLPIDNQFVIPPLEVEKARGHMEEWGYSCEKPTLFIQPFTNFIRKNWPLENFIAIAEFCKQKGYQIIFGGGPADREKLQEVSEHFPVAAGKTNIITSAALINFSSLIIGGDTGLLHVAVALNKRILMISPGKDVFYPYAHPDWTITPKTGSDIKSIPFEQVKQIIEKIL